MAQDNNGWTLSVHPLLFILVVVFGDAFIWRGDFLYGILLNAH
jgi:hypothetical protein